MGGQIRGAVIGYGGAFDMGKHHGTWMERAGMKLVAACDLDEERCSVACVADVQARRTIAIIEAAERSNASGQAERPRDESKEPRLSPEPFLGRREGISSRRDRAYCRPIRAVPNRGTPEAACVRGGAAT